MGQSDITEQGSTVFDPAKFGLGTQSIAPPAPAAPTAPAVSSRLEPAHTKGPVGFSKAALARTGLEAVLVVSLLVIGLQAHATRVDNQKLQSQLSSLQANPQAAVEAQTSSIIGKVSQLMQLPAGETPTVASVSDVAAARAQSVFFNQAANGDNVLMYVKSGQAILYRPSTNKIVLVAPLTFSQATTGTTK